jgi:hypothetical protein
MGCRWWIYDDVMKKRYRPCVMRSLHPLFPPSAGSARANSIARLIDPGFHPQSRPNSVIDIPGFSRPRKKSLRRGSNRPLPRIAHDPRWFEPVLVGNFPENLLPAPSFASAPNQAPDQVNIAMLCKPDHCLCGRGAPSRLQRQPFCKSLAVKS